MQNNNRNMNRPGRRGPGFGGPGGPGGPMVGEKAEDFKGTFKRLAQYMATYKWSVLMVFVLSVSSAVLSIIGPKKMGGITDALIQGFTARLSGTGDIDFTLIGSLLLGLLALYAFSALLSFVQGYMMTGITQAVSYNLRKALSEKISRLPMGFFDRVPHGEVLSRVTNDVDTLWCIDHDVHHLLADDACRAFDHSLLSHFDGVDRQALAKVLRRPAGIPG